MRSTFPAPTSSAGNGSRRFSPAGLFAAAVLVGAFLAEMAGCGPASAPSVPASPTETDGAAVSGSVASESTSAPGATSGTVAATPAVVTRISKGSGPAWTLERAGTTVPVDGRRFTFSRPKGWHLPPRNSKYVIWFKSEGSGQLPRITIAASKTDQPGLTEDRLPQFRDEIATEVGTGSSVTAPPRMIVVAGIPAVEYVKSARLGGQSAETTTIETIFAGQRWQFTLERFRDGASVGPETLYAVLAATTPESSAPVASPLEAADPAS